MELICNYMRDDILRHKLNALTQETFGFDFEGWVKGGYFEGDYLPYSFLEDGRILSNVSVNRMSFLQNGVRRNYIQLGTVMTEESCRGQGLAGKLMEHVLAEYEGKCDGFYLFSNLDALGFYKKLGFQEGLEYQYALKKDFHEMPRRGAFFQKTEGQSPQRKQKYMDAVRNSAANSAFEQINKYGLQMFYTADLSNVYYAEDIDCFAVMEKQEEDLVLQSVIRKEPISLEEVIARIPPDYSSLKLGFSPLARDAAMFDAAAFDGGEDYRFFYRGNGPESIEKERLFFPQLSHA